MTTLLLPEWADVSKPIIGMLHLPALPGAPGYGGQLSKIYERVLGDAEALKDGGVNGLMLENFGDAPFYPGDVPASVTAHMTAIAAEVRRAVDLPLGINVLRNDGSAALSIAQAVGARFIRVNVLCGARLTDQGIVQGMAHELLRLRAALGAGEIKILADVNVKHSSPLGAARPIAGEVGDLLERGGADGVVVSGDATGSPSDREELVQVKEAAGDAPVFVGSGVDADSAGDLLSVADGAIVGTTLKVGGEAGNAVDTARVKALMEAAGKVKTARPTGKQTKYETDEWDRY